MSTKRDSASIKSGEEHKRQKMNDDAASVKQHETGMEDYLVRNNMLSPILVYLPPRDILNCIQTSKKWKEEIDTEYLPSMMLHHRPRDISKCIQASKKWKDKIDTVDIFWKHIVNITVPPTVVDAIKKQARKLTSSSQELNHSNVKYTINYEDIALAFDLKKKKTVEEITEIVFPAPSLDDSTTIHYDTITLTFSWKKKVQVVFLKFLSENGDHVSSEFFELVMIKK